MALDTPSKLHKVLSDAVLQSLHESFDSDSGNGSSSGLTPPSRVDSHALHITPINASTLEVTHSFQAHFDQPQDVATARARASSLQIEEMGTEDHSDSAQHAASAPSQLQALPQQQDSGLLCQQTLLDVNNAVYRTVARQEPCQLTAAQAQNGLHAEHRILRLSQWELNPDNILIGERIAVGGFAEVFVGKFEGTIVAIKLLLNVDASALGRFLHEVDMLAALRHPNLILFMGYARSPALAMVSEYMHRGSLFKIMRKREGKPLEAKLQQSVATSVARGMAYLHNRSPPILHTDLKSPNILVDSHWRIKIGDFGLAKLRAGRKFVTAGVESGTPEWMAPEVLRCEGYNEASDVYSYGVVLWEVLTGDCPWDSMHPMQVVGAVGFGGKQLPTPTGGDPFLINLTMRCMASDSRDRPSFSQVLEELEGQYAPGKPEVMRLSESTAASSAADSRRALLPAPSPAASSESSSRENLAHPLPVPTRGDSAEDERPERRASISDGLSAPFPTGRARAVARSHGTSRAESAMHRVFEDSAMQLFKPQSSSGTDSSHSCTQLPVHDVKLTPLRDKTVPVAAAAAAAEAAAAAHLRNREVSTFAPLPGDGDDAAARTAAYLQNRFAEAEATDSSLGGSTSASNAAAASGKAQNYDKRQPLGQVPQSGEPQQSQEVQQQAAGAVSEEQQDAQQGAGEERPPWMLRTWGGSDVESNDAAAGGSIPEAAKNSQQHAPAHPPKASPGQPATSPGHQQSQHQSDRESAFAEQRQPPQQPSHSPADQVSDQQAAPSTAEAPSAQQQQLSQDDSPLSPAHCPGLTPFELAAQRSPFGSRSPHPVRHCSASGSPKALESPSLPQTISDSSARPDSLATLSAPPQLQGTGGAMPAHAAMHAQQGAAAAVQLPQPAESAPPAYRSPFEVAAELQPAFSLALSAKPHPRRSLDEKPANADKSGPGNRQCKDAGSSRRGGDAENGGAPSAAAITDMAGRAVAAANERAAAGKRGAGKQEAVQQPHSPPAAVPAHSPSQQQEFSSAHASPAVSSKLPSRNLSTEPSAGSMWSSAGASVGGSSGASIGRAASDHESGASGASVASSLTKRQLHQRVAELKAQQIERLSQQLFAASTGDRLSDFEPRLLSDHGSASTHNSGGCSSSFSRSAAAGDGQSVTDASSRQSSAATASSSMDRCSTGGTARASTDRHSSRASAEHSPAHEAGSPTELSPITATLSSPRSLAADPSGGGGSFRRRSSTERQTMPLMNVIHEDVRAETERLRSSVLGSVPSSGGASGSNSHDTVASGAQLKGMHELQNS